MTSRVNAMSYVPQCIDFLSAVSIVDHMMAPRRLAPRRLAPQMAPQVGAAQVGVAQVGAAQVGAAQVGVARDGAAAGWRRSGWRRSGRRRSGWRRSGWRSGSVGWRSCGCCAAQVGARSGWPASGWRRSGWRRFRLAPIRFAARNPRRRDRLRNFPVSSATFTARQARAPALRAWRYRFRRRARPRLDLPKRPSTATTRQDVQHVAHRPCAPWFAATLSLNGAGCLRKWICASRCVSYKRPKRLIDERNSFVIDSAITAPHRLSAHYDSGCGAGQSVFDGGCQRVAAASLRDIFVVVFHAARRRSEL